VYLQTEWADGPDSIAAARAHRVEQRPVALTRRAGQPIGHEPL
jgi:hypothetical protein